ncbi:sugar transferase [Alicyclobacillus sp. ALC3]|uniref:sugar transferase n=1 Tax=Alicyclobacillus sp. ALC3 TaxID=2796143 RepID=UPI00237862CF|nr:sugar transferase [Alicyclobacillus sp. ALC3]WDL95249.1 sugar transferase [Alicyclobacillus sp. ALC3]
MNHLARYRKTLGFLTDLITMVAGYYVAYWLTSVFDGHATFAYMHARFLQTEMLCFVSWTLTVAIYAEYPSRRNAGIARDLLKVVSMNLWAVLIFSVSTFILKEISVSRLFVFSYVLTEVILMFLNRYFVRLVLYLLRQYGWDSRTRVLVGVSQHALRYLEEVAENKQFGLQLVGYVADAEHEWDIPYLGSISHIESILSQLTPDGVVIALKISDPNTERVISACEVLGISVELLLDGLSSKIASSTVHHGARISSLALSAIPHTPTSLLVKRITDIGISVLAILLLSPLFLFVAIAIRIEDGGPVFFVQERVGLKNRKFQMFKFRSMRVDAEGLKPSLLHMNEMSGPVFKLTDDPRVTRVGAMLRQTSIDELPQLFNVLLGSMSLVGPRPPLPSEVALYDDMHRRRLSVKPGLTCLWQIAGRNDIDFDRWMELDLAYIDNWSYLNDVKIMFRTIPAVLRRHGAR